MFKNRLVASIALSLPSCLQTGIFESRDRSTAESDGVFFHEKRKNANRTRNGQRDGTQVTTHTHTSHTHTLGGSRKTDSDRSTHGSNRLGSQGLRVRTRKNQSRQLWHGCGSWRDKRSYLAGLPLQGTRASVRLLVANDALGRVCDCFLLSGRSRMTRVGGRAASRNRRRLKIPGRPDDDSDRLGTRHETNNYVNRPRSRVVRTRKQLCTPSGRHRIRR